MSFDGAYDSPRQRLAIAKNHIRDGLQTIDISARSSSIVSSDVLVVVVGDLYYVVSDLVETVGRW